MIKTIDYNALQSQLRKQIKERYPQHSSTLGSTTEHKILKKDCKRRKHTAKKIQLTRIYDTPTALNALIKNSSHHRAGTQVTNSTCSTIFVTEGSWFVPIWWLCFPRVRIWYTIFLSLPQYTCQMLLNSIMHNDQPIIKDLPFTDLCIN